MMLFWVQSINLNPLLMRKIRENAAGIDISVKKSVCFY